MTVLDLITTFYKQTVGIDSRLRIEQKLADLGADIAEIKNQQKLLSDRLEYLHRKMAVDLLSLQRTLAFLEHLKRLRESVAETKPEHTSQLLKNDISGQLGQELRRTIREGAGLSQVPATGGAINDLLAEIRFINTNATLLKPIMQALFAKRVLYVGQAYYNAWYLSRALRHLGWSADVLNWDTNPSSQIYYHGQDFHFDGTDKNELEKNLQFFLSALYSYDVFHFSNSQGIAFSGLLQNFFQEHLGEHAEIYLLKALGKKIVYSNNGCLDGVSQTQFAKWGPESICTICIWRDQPAVCSDEKNLSWGKFRNSVADYQCLLGGNRADYNLDRTIHEAPEFYCLDREIWRPGLDIPANYRLDDQSGATRLYHAVGNKNDRTNNDGVNIKSSHIYLPLIEKLRSEGIKIDLLEPTNVPNIEVRFIQAQADIFLDMLTYGWFGANAREAMMLGKPVICYIRPSWLESVRKEIPEYAEELPIISATPHNIEHILRDLIANPEKRQEIGQRSRAFAEKWHSSQAGARRFDNIYTQLLQGNPLLMAEEPMENARE